MPYRDSPTDSRPPSWPTSRTRSVNGLRFRGDVRLARPRPVGKVTDEEIVALAVAQAITGTVSDRRFLGTIDRLLPEFFPDLPDQSQYNRRLRRLTPWITTVQLMLAELVAEGQVRLADGTLIARANYLGCASKSEFAEHAAYGYCPSKSQFVWGMRLVLISDRRGIPVGYDLVGPKTDQERDAVLEPAAHPGSRLFADGGFWGREYLSCMRLIDIALVTPAKHKLSQAPPPRSPRPNPPRDRVGLRHPQTPDRPRDPPRQDPPRPRRSYRPTTPSCLCRSVEESREYVSVCANVRPRLLGR